MVQAKNLMPRSSAAVPLKSLALRCCSRTLTASTMISLGMPSNSAGTDFQLHIGLVMVTTLISHPTDMDLTAQLDASPHCRLLIFHASSYGQKLYREGKCGVTIRPYTINEHIMLHLMFSKPRCAINSSMHSQRDRVDVKDET